MRIPTRVFNCLRQPTPILRLRPTPIIPQVTRSIPLQTQTRHYTAKKETGSAGSSESPDPLTSTARPKIPSESKPAPAQTVAADVATSPVLDPTSVAKDLSSAPPAPETLIADVKTSPSEEGEKVTYTPPVTVANGNAASVGSKTVEKPRKGMPWLQRTKPLKGRKNVYLPNFTFALVRTPHLPPNFAQFIVPLNINKLDVKNYLQNLYGIRCLAVRSFVSQQGIVEKSRDGTRREFRRPRAIKKMTVEIGSPFVWPAAPTDLSPWDHELFEKVEKNQAAVQASFALDAGNKPPSDQRRRLAEQAKKMGLGGHS